MASAFDDMNAAPSAAPLIRLSSPIVFQARGLVADTSLRVFDTDFHVHSTLLKLYSHFFYTYLDSADKDNSGSAGKKFKYEWITKILDGGNDWQLVCAGPKAGENHVRDLSLNVEVQTTAFHNLLKAMYRQKYFLENFNDLTTLTALARFYMALPIISQSLLNAMSRVDSDFAQCIKNNAAEVLQIAIELRSPELYRDSMIWCLGVFSCPLYNNLKVENRKLWKAADNAYNKLTRRVFVAFNKLISEIIRIELVNQDSNQPPFFSQLVCSIADNMGIASLDIELPVMFREIAYCMKSEKQDLREKILVCFRDVVGSDLHFPILESNESGDDKCYGHFLQNVIDDDDLPFEIFKFNCIPHSRGSIPPPVPLALAGTP
ncbi:hypothetical protein LZ554_008463 [Drepanopeziza brunnea f. sp. 'monogermtubi']|nr:hypothetical protein LZ554_008463 [Drepanopeziza brunnea f. sp. 'monogermtubi']